MEKIEFKVDLADPEDLRAKVAEAEKTWKEKRRAMRDAREEATYWENMVTRLRRLAELDDGGTARARRSPVQDEVVRVVEEASRPLRPIQVTQQLRAEGQQVNNPAINAALYAAAKAGRLRRTGERQYESALKKEKKAKKPPPKKTSKT